MHQLGLEAFQDQPGADDPAEQEAERGRRPASRPRGQHRRREQGRPRVEHRQGHQRVIAREPAVLLHPRRDPLDDLGLEGEPEELAVRKDADGDVPRDRHPQEQQQSAAPADSTPAGRRPAPPPRHRPRGRHQRRPDRPLQQGRQAHRQPEPGREPSRVAAGQPPETRLGRDDQAGEGRVGRRQLRLGDHDRHGRQGERTEQAGPRPGDRSAEPPRQQAGRRPGEGRDQPGAERVVAADRVAGAHQPVDQDRLVIARLAVEGGMEPVAPLPHFPGAGGVSRLVAIPEPDPAVPRQVERQGQGNDPDRLPDESPSRSGRAIGDQWVGNVQRTPRASVLRDRPARRSDGGPSDYNEIGLCRGVR